VKYLTTIIRIQRSIEIVVKGRGQSTMYKHEDRSETKTTNIFLHRVLVSKVSGL
jgi:hypothetical protein